MKQHKGPAAVAVLNNFITLVRGWLCVMLASCALAYVWFFGTTDTLESSLWWLVVGLSVYAIVIGSPERIARPRRFLRLLIAGVALLYVAIILLARLERILSPDATAANMILLPVECILLASAWAARRAGRATAGEQVVRPPTG